MNKTGIKPLIAVIDYKAGNLTSVQSALSYIGADFFVSDDPNELGKADKLIFPGVGQACSAMENLKKSELDIFITEFSQSGKHMLGICLGSQILLDSSEEGNTNCLGIVKGDVKLFTMQNMKVPHMGWNQVKPLQNHYLFNGIESGSSFYFVHSYYTSPLNRDNALCETEYGITFVSGIIRDNLVAVQFHPEKSGKNGLKMLENFMKA